MAAAVLQQIGFTDVRSLGGDCARSRGDCARKRRAPLPPGPSPGIAGPRWFPRPTANITFCSFGFLRFAAAERSLAGKAKRSRGGSRWHGSCSCSSQAI